MVILRGLYYVIPVILPVTTTVSRDFIFLGETSTSIEGSANTVVDVNDNAIKKTSIVFNFMITKF